MNLLSYVIIGTVCLLFIILILKWNQFKNWVITDLGETKLAEKLKNNLLLPTRFWWKWNILKKIRKYDIDKYRSRNITFEDNFNKGELDREKWNTSFPWGRHTADGGAWSTDGDNLKFEGSTVQFQTKYEPGVYEGWWGKVEQKFTTAHIDTKNKFQQQMGRFDIKVKLTDKVGLWPAFWLLTETYAHPNIPRWEKDKPVNEFDWGESIKPEIDVFEQFGTPGKNKRMQFTLHAGLTYPKPWGRAIPSKIKGVDFSDKFVMVSVEITKDWLKWYVNDCLVKVLYQKHLSTDERVFRPMYLIISTGTNIKPDVLLKEYEKDNNYLPDGMTVDWVRVYKPLYYGNPDELEFES